VLSGEVSLTITWKITNKTIHKPKTINAKPNAQHIYHLIFTLHTFCIYHVDYIHHGALPKTTPMKAGLCLLKLTAIFKQFVQQFSPGFGGH
jgi:hypothetical protein